MAKANAVANYLVHLRNENHENGIQVSLSNLKIQKIMYFCQGVFAVAHGGQKLIDDLAFEAWRYGPVIPQVYYRFNQYGQNDIAPEEAMDTGIHEHEARIIEEVWAALRDRSAFDLVEISHAEDGPWTKVYVEGKNNEINHDLIVRYFGG